MRLTLINMFKKTVPGHIFRGKRRLVKPVSQRAMDTLTREYERQEQVMLLLRHPYLTLEESSGHAKELQKREKLVAKWTDEQTLRKMKPHVTIEERLNQLKIKEAWD
ncbi:large ribosomal subunit protein mL63 [Drosophila suzukii]|uniref:Large ribosomal subunit protein mL63 n=1 Tax=Drosophila suzukii TaxID=28584 RepID=A0AB39ZMH9_DROSZ|nr:ribosomal protein 63, mitochondrial [Drosophila suzukii]XP_016948405.1 ribosomal protein 63, mitochondrial [Drosophila biarmipes]XP_037723739.1 ribosomal protein 63, mitochondrial [Drosophila subpulchrella]